MGFEPAIPLCNPRQYAFLFCPAIPTYVCTFLPYNGVYCLLCNYSATLQVLTKATNSDYPVVMNFTDSQSERNPCGFCGRRRSYCRDIRHSDRTDGGACRAVGKTGRGVELQARLSKNSGKPPSSDGYGKKNRTESLRKLGQKPNGRQLGHEGHTLKRSDDPDRTEKHEPLACENCQRPLDDVTVVGEEER